jgi:hypothetical protein
VGSRASLDTVEKKNLLPLLGIESRPSSPQPVATLNELEFHNLYSTPDICLDNK